MAKTGVHTTKGWDRGVHTTKKTSKSSRGTNARTLVLRKRRCDTILSASKMSANRLRPLEKVEKSQ